jgi:23S rRNA pseudouridine1911/1915/1917 synthase
VQLNAGDNVDINTTREWQTFSNPRLKIVYEDDYVLVVNKGYGLLSMGNDKIKDGTAYSLLKDYLKRKDPRNKLFIVHRLDQHTSGLMMFAKTVEAKEAMQHNWNNMVIDRRYAAVVEGRPDEDEGTIDSFLAENSMHVVYSTKNPEEGKRAVTRWKLVKSRNGYSLLDVSLDTGRKNQIRVHMKEMGHPIAGDKKYGAKTSPMHRLALHAHTLRFIHPITRVDMNFSAPLPAAFTKLV